MSMAIRAGLAALLCTTAIITGRANAQPTEQWSIATGRVTMSPVRFADVDGDGIKEVLFATMGPIGDAFSSGTVHVVDQDGNELPGWPLTLPEPISGAALAIGDVNDDGDVEIVAQGWFNTWVWRADGTDLPGWPKSTGTSSSASPALADLDGDGDLEIIVPTASTMHVWHHDGSEMNGWPQSSSENFQAPAVADLDGDGSLEIIAGTWRPQFPDAVPFELYAWHADGTLVNGFPIGNLGSIRGPIAVADVDVDGQLELVVRAGDTLHLFNANGTETPGWPVDPGDPIRNAAPAVGDIDGDGDLEIFIGGFEVNAYHHDATTVAGFPAEVGATFNINSSIIVASIDDETTEPEIIVKIANNIAALNADGTDVPGFPLAFTDDNQSGTFSPTPAVDDVDGDCLIEYAFLSVSGTLAYFDQPEPYAPGAQHWPTYQQDVDNNAQHDPPVTADITGDGVVNTEDLLALLGTWGNCRTPGGCIEDVNNDGAINTEDLLYLLGTWGTCG